MYVFTELRQSMRFLCFLSLAVVVMSKKLPNMFVLVCGSNTPQSFFQREITLANGDEVTAGCLNFALYDASNDKQYVGYLDHCSVSITVSSDCAGQGCGLIFDEANTIHLVTGNLGIGSIYVEFIESGGNVMPGSDVAEEGYTFHTASAKHSVIAVRGTGDFENRVGTHFQLGLARIHSESTEPAFTFDNMVCLEFEPTRNGNGGGGGPGGDDDDE